MSHLLFPCFLKIGILNEVLMTLVGGSGKAFLPATDPRRGLSGEGPVAEAAAGRVWCVCPTESRLGAVGVEGGEVGGWGAGQGGGV